MVERRVVRAGQCESEGRVRRRHAAADGHGQGARGEHRREDAGAEEWVWRWAVRCRPAVGEPDLRGQSVQQRGGAAADEWVCRAMVMTDCNALTTVLFGSSVFSNDFVLTVAGEGGVWA